MPLALWPLQSFSLSPLYRSLPLSSCVHSIIGFLLLFSLPYGTFCASISLPSTLPNIGLQTTAKQQNCLVKLCHVGERNETLLFALPPPVLLFTAPAPPPPPPGTNVCPALSPPFSSAMALPTANRRSSSSCMCDTDSTRARHPLPSLSLRSHLKGLFPLTGCGYTPLFRASLSKKPSESFPSPPTSFSTHAYVHSALPFLPLGSSTYRMQSPFLEETRGDLAFFFAAWIEHSSICALFAAWFPQPDRDSTSVPGVPSPNTSGDYPPTPPPPC